MQDWGDFFNADNTLRHEVVEDLLVEVCCGKHIFRGPGNSYVLYASRPPTLTDQNSARILYTTRLYEAKGMGLKSRSELEAFGLRMGIIDVAEREEKDGIMRQLERYRKIRDHTPSAQQKLEIDRDTQVVRDRLMKIELKEQTVLQHSAESLAEDARISYYIGRCTLGGRLLDDAVWPTFEDFENEQDQDLIAAARTGYSRVLHGLPTKLIRGLGRSVEWRNRWQAISESGASPFEGNSANWDRNKLNLIYWSKFYDNIYSHPDCPEERIINDDDALQGWVNTQIAKRGQQKPVGVSNRPSPTYIQNGQRKKMTKLGSDQVIQVNQPYKLRT
jgi:hypothetical protein